MDAVTYACVVREYPCCAAGAREARILAARFYGAGDDDALLVVAELAANAARYAAEVPPGTFRVALHAADPRGRRRVEVADPSDVPPRPRTAAEDEVDGRGLAIVRALCLSLEFRPLRRGGKVVCALLPPPGASG